MRFEKWQALGNDYLIVERAELPFEPTAGRIQLLCSSHYGIGSDGLLLLSPCEGHVARLTIFNPDGSRAELSGNGGRQAIMYLRRRGWTDRDEFTILTDAGVLRPTITGADTCTIDLGHASLTSADYPGGAQDGRGELQVGESTWAFQHISIGNPQCTIAVGDLDELAALDLPAIGPPIEASSLFPHRTNVSWYYPYATDRIRARIFERGVGETLSSGTGATGAAIGYLLGSGRRAGTVMVLLDGGELKVAVDEDLRVELTGWARPVFAGSITKEFERDLDEAE
ncbi:MAG TPA: diaminopimelate epimerase [Solirubrobacteraceae bacterium]|nr:diaminopimelate epimerase [Solirubrobacteraceae bacterium]